MLLGKTRDSNAVSSSRVEDSLKLARRIFHVAADDLGPGEVLRDQVNGVVQNVRSLSLGLVLGGKMHESLRQDVIQAALQVVGGPCERLPVAGEGLFSFEPTDFGLLEVL